jgi:uncharacterized repeat protein (TIGR03803 family)
LVDFNGASDSAYFGVRPYGNLIQASDGNLYGMTYEGGTNFYGNIFKYNPNTGVITDLIDFTGDAGSYNGEQPYFNSLIQASDSNLYGMTYEGGTNYRGNIFKYNPTTSVFTDLVDFGDTTYIGGLPEGSLIQASDGNLYGMTQQGTTYTYGNIFKYNPTTNAFTNLVNFTGDTGAYLGATPYGSLIQASDGNLYGMTSDGSRLGFGNGNIFTYDPATSSYTDLVDFTYSDTPYLGARPHGSLIQASDGNLYGMTQIGGVNGVGTIFRYNPTIRTYTDLVDFALTGFPDGNQPLGDLLEDTDYATGINNINSSSSVINVYPNPNTGYFGVTGLTQGLSVEIYNCEGQRLVSLIADKTTMDFNITAYASGMYLVRVQNQDGTMAVQKKIVKTQ